MNLISILIFLVVVELILYIVNSVIPMPEWLRVVVNVLAALFVIVWLLRSFGFATGFHALRLR